MGSQRALNEDGADQDTSGEWEQPVHRTGSRNVSGAESNRCLCCSVQKK